MERTDTTFHCIAGERWWGALRREENLRANCEILL